MKSNILELVGQIKGIPTRLRYRVFVDNMSDYTYVFLQTDSNSKQPLLAKKELERHAMGAGIKIQKYHADNSRYIDNAWTDHLKTMNQNTSLCGVNAHLKNGKVKRHIHGLVFTSTCC
jgi:hypothetical protein